MIANDQARQVNIKPATGRVFAFAIPTAWLSVADVARQFKDLKSSNWVREHLMGPFGGVKPGPQAVESQTHVLAWVREDVARQLGLITDGNFPGPSPRRGTRSRARPRRGQTRTRSTGNCAGTCPICARPSKRPGWLRSVARAQRRAAEDTVGAEFAAARRDYAAAMAAADAALGQEPEDFPPVVGDELRSAMDLAAQGLRSHQGALLTALTDTATPVQRAAAETRLASARQALSEADALVDSIRRRERDRMAAEAQEAFDSRMAAAAENLASARDAAHAAAQAFRAAEHAVEARLAEVTSQERRAETAAEALHHLRAQTDRLTRGTGCPRTRPAARRARSRPAPGCASRR